MKHASPTRAGISLLLLLVALATSACGQSASSDDPPIASPEAIRPVEAAVATTSPDAMGEPEAADEPAAADSAPDEPASTGESPAAAAPWEAADAPESAGMPAAGSAPDIVPEPSAAPADPGAARLVRLTEPGCCTQLFWSADSRRVQFIDKPAPDAQVGIWAVDADRPGSPPELVAPGVAYYSADLAYEVVRDEDTTTIVRRADGQRWEVPAGGRAVSISPDGTRIAWQVSPPNSVPPERQTARVWVANIDGGGAREVASLPRGGLSGWLGNDALLVRSRDRLDADEDVLAALSLADGSRRELVRSERIGGVAVAPGGKWIAYYISRLPDTAANGLWIAPTGGGAPKRLESSLFGAYRWRDGERLLIVPMQSDPSSHVLTEVEAATLATRRLTDPATTAFKITGSDWSVSPDGRRVAFVESRDKSIWVIELP